jgi:N4-gp56 family major capsid protein
MAANFGLGGDHHVTTAIAGNFIPELWSDEVIGAYKSNLVLANLVTKMSHKGKKGDTIHIPKPNRGSASVKAAGSQVTLSNATNAQVNISINKHYEYSKLIEDIAEVQALASMRKFYTDDAGFALATQVESDLFGTMTGGSFVKGDGTAWTSGAGGSITDAGIRKMILALDNADVPMNDRVIILPPVAASDMLGINRFTEQQFIGNGDAIKTGKIGQIYGIDVFVTNSAPTDGTAGAGPNREGLIFHRDAAVLAEQVGVRTQTQYKQEYLGDLFTADTIYGVGELRSEASVAFKVTK